MLHEEVLGSWYMCSFPLGPSPHGLCLILEPFNKSDRSNGTICIYFFLLLLLFFLAEVINWFAPNDRTVTLHALDSEFDNDAFPANANGWLPYYNVRSARVLRTLLLSIPQRKILKLGKYMPLLGYATLSIPLFSSSVELIRLNYLLWSLLIQISRQT